VDVGLAGHHAVAALLAPDVSFVADDAVHILVVGRPVELLLFCYDRCLELHLLEHAQLGEPRLRLVDDLQLGDLQAVFRVEDVKVRLEGQDVVVSLQKPTPLSPKTKIGDNNIQTNDASSTPRADTRRLFFFRMCGR
jgi:hypothetical protein